MNFLIVFYILCLTASFSAAQDWSYHYQAEWYDKFKECSLSHQSPIEINERDAILAYFIPPVQFYNHNVASPWPAEIHNNGFGAAVTLSPECNKPQISGGPLPYNSTYEAEGFHFHWGSMDHHGSEHSINSQRYSLEAHIVYRNVKYSTKDEASQYPDGIAVQALFYKAQSNWHTDFDGLQIVVAGLKGITQWNSSALIENVTLAALFGNIDTSQFYTYQGSLTTPPCSQAVTWIVFPQVINISQEQMKQFRLLSDFYGAALVNNYRFIQPMAERKVYLRRNMVTSEGLSPSNPTGPTVGPYYPEYDYTNEI